MIILKIILITVGATFSIFGHLIYFRKKYNLINGFESDFKADRKTEAYAKRVGMIELILGVLLVCAGICLMIMK